MCGHNLLLPSNPIRGIMKKKVGRKSNLNIEERKAIAESIKEGKHVKQVAANWQVSSAYVYGCVTEFLEWRLEWRMKE